MLVVVLLFNLKDVINRTEAMRAMNRISDSIKEREANYAGRKVPVPPRSVIDSLETSVQGRARLGELHYRAMWIDLNAGDDTVLAYTKRDYKSWFVSSGYVVLWLDGRVEWMEQGPFEDILAAQQSPEELATIIP